MPCCLPREWESNWPPAGFRRANGSRPSRSRRSAVGNLIRPGDWVDVLVHVRADQGRGILKTATKTILQNIRVYAVNNMWDISSTSGEKSLTAKTISLIVSPEQAELVSLAVSLGDISLVMRGPDDKEIRTLAGRDPLELLGLSVAADTAAPNPNAANPLHDLIATKPAPPEPAANPAAARGTQRADLYDEHPRRRQNRAVDVGDADGLDRGRRGWAVPVWRINYDKSKPFDDPTAPAPAAQSNSGSQEPKDVYMESNVLLVTPSKSKNGR